MPAAGGLAPASSTAKVVVVDGGGCGSWRRAGLGVDGLAWLREEEAGEEPRRGRLGERDWLRR